MCSGSDIGKRKLARPATVFLADVRCSGEARNTVLSHAPLAQLKAPPPTSLTAIAELAAPNDCNSHQGGHQEQSLYILHAWNAPDKRGVYST
jgi:hypothetical protein